MANILVVDDDEVILATVRALLVKAGHSVFTVTNGIDAVDVAKIELFNLIISDANMPGGVSGFNLVSTLRTMPRYKKTPILFLTGRKEKKDVSRAIESGVDDYVVKPIDFELFSAKIKSLLEKQPINYPFYDGKLNQTVQWVVNFELYGISEQGLSAKSPTQLILNKKICLQADFFVQIGIEPPTLRVASCTPLDDLQKFFRVQLNFIGLNEEELQKIRRWVNTKANTKK